MPCTIAPLQAPSFSVGPVTFHHLQHFPSADFGVSRGDFWPHPTSDTPKPIVGGFYFERLVALAAERWAPWFAVVTVPGRAIDESIGTADVLTDIALTALQLAAPGLDLRGISRATGRAAPVYRVDVSFKGSLPQEKITNREPARAIDPSLFAHVRQVRLPRLWP